MSEAGVGVRCRAESRADGRGVSVAWVVVRVPQPGVCRGGARSARLPRSGKALETVTRKLRRAARRGKPGARGVGTGPASRAPRRKLLARPCRARRAWRRPETNLRRLPLCGPRGRGAHYSMRPFASRRPSPEAASNISPTAAVEQSPGGDENLRLAPARRARSLLDASGGVGRAASRKTCDRRDRPSITERGVKGEPDSARAGRCVDRRTFCLYVHPVFKRGAPACSRAPPHAPGAAAQVIRIQPFRSILMKATLWRVVAPFLVGALALLPHTGAGAPASAQPRAESEQQAQCPTVRVSCPDTSAV